MAELMRFAFGAIVGSFLNVLALRYDPDRWLGQDALGGRSRCPHCGKTLRWFELVPLLSFLFQLGRCRSCKAGLSFQYPVVEILSGLIFVFVPQHVGGCDLRSAVCELRSVLWVAAFLVLLLIALIDLRLTIIPDEANTAIAIIGFVIIVVGYADFGLTRGSFLGSYALLFGVREGMWMNRLVGVVFPLFLLGSLVLGTRGRGMGLGDVKFAGALGALFGWPDIFLVLAMSFIMGSAAGLGAIALGRKHLKSALPFGPFLSAGAAAVFFSGASIMKWYFGLFPG